MATTPLLALDMAFLLRDGEFHSIDVPGATASTAFGINARGDIAGIATAAGDHGYLLRKDVFSTFDYPGASRTQPFGMNARGDIVGTYTTAGVLHGFRVER